MRRRVVDGNTVALYHMEELTHLNWLTIAGAVNGRHLTNSGSATVAKRDTPKTTNILNAFGTGRRGRVFLLDTNANNAVRLTNPGEAATMFQGEWTIKVFARVDDLTAQRCIFAYSVDGESTITNSQCTWLINTDGRQELFTEDGASGTNRSHTQTTGTGVTVGAVHMLTVVKNATHYRFFIDGVFQQAIAIIAQPTGGTSCTYLLGKNLTTATVRFVGALRSLMIRSVAQSDAEVLADAALLGSPSVDGTLLFTDSTNVWEHWTMANEDPDAIDQSKYGMHLHQDPAASDLLAGVLMLPEVGGKYWSSTGAELVAPLDPNATRLRGVINAGNYAIAMLFRIADTATDDQGLFQINTVGSDLSSADNFFGFERHTSTKFRFFYEYTKELPLPVEIGKDVILDIVGAFTTASIHGVHHLVVTGSSAGGFEVYLDTVLIGSGADALPEVGSNGYLKLGAGPSGAGGNMFGVIGPTAIKDVHWELADVQNDFEIFFGNGEETPPVVAYPLG